jgi:hypothetical protein
MTTGVVRFHRSPIRWTMAGSILNSIITSVTLLAEEEEEEEEKM